MPLPASRAQAIAACLAAAGFEPHVKRSPGHIRVEVDPGSPTADTWRALLAALERGDRFGLNSDAVGATAWALIYTKTPGHDGQGSG